MAVDTAPRGGPAGLLVTALPRPAGRLRAPTGRLPDGGRARCRGNDADLACARWPYRGRGWHSGRPTRRTAAAARGSAALRLRRCRQGGCARPCGARRAGHTRAWACCPRCSWLPSSTQCRRARRDVRGPRPLARGPGKAAVTNAVCENTEGGAHAVPSPRARARYARKAGRAVRSTTARDPRASPALTGEGSARRQPELATSRPLASRSSRRPYSAPGQRCSYVDMSARWPPSDTVFSRILAWYTPFLRGMLPKLICLWMSAYGTTTKTFSH